MLIGLYYFILEYISVKQEKIYQGRRDEEHFSSAYFEDHFTEAVRIG